MNWPILILTGIVFGLGAVLLVRFGNPGNYGFCAACHLRDIAGALGLHNANTLQYARPEVLGWVLGAFSLASLQGQFRARGGSNPVVRFILGMAMMIGALVFLGCPLRAILRLSAGDLNGLTGIAGFLSGISIGIIFLKRGFNLGRAKLHTSGGAKFFGYLPALAALQLIISVAFNAPYLNFSAKGPGSMHAPVWLSLAAGLVAGGLAWKTRMCLSGGFRDFLLVRDTYMLSVYAILFVSALAANLHLGFFKLGFDKQPLAHTMHLWNFLGLFLTGIAATLAGGCPLRQLVLAGEGNTDAAFCVLGMLVGAGIAHQLNIAASPNGVLFNGQIAVLAGLIVTTAIGFIYREQITPIGKGA
ncbi:MAG: YedE family putative selenium transporter [Negativicutes bacterium]|nr:YedE family putative selenium transporter [Negativicutes bacterium]